MVVVVVVVGSAELVPPVMTTLLGLASEQGEGGQFPRKAIVIVAESPPKEPTSLVPLVAAPT